MRRIFYSFSALFFVVTLLALGPAYASPLGGDSEVLLSGGASHTQGSNNGNFNADLSYGYYLTPGWLSPSPRLQFYR